MQNIKRRQFLHTTLALSTAVAAAGCGGGGGGGGDPVAGPPSPVPSPSPSPSPAPGPSPAPPPTPGPTGSMQFTLQTGTTQSSAPFCLGFAFRQGDIPAGSSAVPSVANVQVTPKNRWPDGSLRFAIIAGSAALSSAQASTVSFAVGTAPTGTNLTLADLKATGATASIACGSFGTVSWTGTDWDSPFLTWVGGPAMSSWIYRKPVGSDAHLVGWLEVRLYAGGAVEVLPWIENGYLNVPGATDKNATYAFTLGGTQRFSAAIDLPHHCRTPLLSGTILSHWLGTDPGVTARPDVIYLQNTELVPSYRATVQATEPIVTSLPATFTPLQQGSYSAGMAQTGYQPTIGLIPEWDVLFLTSTDGVSTYAAVQRNAYSAGRYAIHYRDETTNRPLRFSAYPNLSLNASSINQYPPASSGTPDAGWDVPHHPSVGFMAYLSTGRWYFMEELQFAATLNFLNQVDIYRQFSDGVYLSNSGASTVRGAAWSVRTLAQAAVITPDDDTPMATEFLNSLAANVEFNHGRFVAQPNNPFGFVTPYGDTYGTPTDGTVTDAPWQQDFYTAAFGYALAMQPNIGSAALGKLSAFFAWKARSIIGRLGGTSATEWLYRDAGVYTFVVAPEDTPDWTGGTGPWFSDWGAIYKASLGTPNPGVAGDLRGGYYPEATDYWGNLQPAIAYAARHAVAGAADAYARMTGAGNWNDLVVAFNQAPVWGVRPANSL